MSVGTLILHLLKYMLGTSWFGAFTSNIWNVVCVAISGAQKKCTRGPISFEHLGVCQFKCKLGPQIPHFIGNYMLGASWFGAFTSNIWNVIRVAISRAQKKCTRGPISSEHLGVCQFKYKFGPQMPHFIGKYMLGASWFGAFMSKI